MPIITYTSQGADKVVGDLSKQGKAFQSLTEKVNACNGDTSKITETVKAFVLQEGKAAEATRRSVQAYDAKSKTLRQAINTVSKYASEYDKANQKHFEALNALNTIRTAIRNHQAAMTAKTKATKEDWAELGRLKQAEEMAAKAVQKTTQGLYAQSEAGKRATLESRAMADAQTRTNAIIERGITSLQRNTQELVRLNNEYQSGAISSRQYTEARRILMAEQARLVQNLRNEQRALAMNTDAARRARMEADLMAAAQRNVSSIIERGVTPIQRNAQAVARLNQDHKNGAISSRQHAEGLRVLNAERIRLLTGANQNLSEMRTILPSIVSGAQSIAAAFGMGLGVAGVIMKARQELQKLNEARKQMQSENISVASAEVALGEVIGHGDPEYLKKQKIKVRVLADKMQLPYTTIFPIVHDAISASMETTMDAKIRDAMEVTEAAALLFPHDSEKAKETALGAQNIRKWDPSIKNAKEAVGRVQILGLAGQVADMKKVAENAPRAIGAVSPFGDSPAFGAALWGEGTHLMTDPHGAMEVGFVARMEKFLFDFSQSRDKNTGELLRPEMAELKTGEERLRHLQKISLERPDAIQGEMIEYLKGLSPEKTAAILDDAVNMSEQQLKMPEEFIKAMKGKGLAIQWGPMVMMLTNKHYIKRLQDRIDEMKKMWDQGEAFFEADVQSRSDSYKPLLADLNMKWLAEKSSSEYMSAGLYQKFYDDLMETLSVRAGTPTLQREWGKLKNKWGAVQDWSGLHSAMLENMVETAQNVNLSQKDRAIGVGVLSQGVEILERFMPETDKPKVEGKLKESLDTALIKFVENGLNANTVGEFFSAGGNQSHVRLALEDIDQRIKVSTPQNKRSQYGLYVDQTTEVLEARRKRIQDLEYLIQKNEQETKERTNTFQFPSLPLQTAIGDVPLEERIIQPPELDFRSEPAGNARPAPGPLVVEESPDTPIGTGGVSDMFRRKNGERSGSPMLIEEDDTEDRIADALTEIGGVLREIAPIIRDAQRDRLELARIRSFNNPALMEYPEQDMRTIYG